MPTTTGNIKLTSIETQYIYIYIYIYIYADLYSFKVSGKKEKPILLLVKSSALHKIP